MAAAQVLSATHTVDDKVKAVDDKIAVVIDGAQLVTKGICLTPIWLLEGKETRVVIRQLAEDMDQVKRSWHSFHVSIGVQT